MRNITAWDVAGALTTHWMFCNGPSVSLLVDNGETFSSKLMLSIRIILEVRNRVTTTYHPGENGSTEQFNRNITSVLRHNVSDHRRNWDLFADALTSASNTQVHSLTGMAPLDVVVSADIKPVSFSALTSLVMKTPQQTRREWQINLKALMVTHKKEITVAQDRYNRNFNARLRRIAHHPKVLGYVFLRRDCASFPEGGHES